MNTQLVVTACCYSDPLAQDYWAWVRCYEGYRIRHCDGCCHKGRLSS